jgi:UDP-glucuronate 4-epimerase
MLKENRNFELSKYKNFKSIKLDISSRIAMEDFFGTYNFDLVIHLAAQAGVRYSITNPHVYINSNINGFLNILEGCRYRKIKRLIYASSSSVYGGIKEIPFNENMKLDTPISLYASTKKSNELMAHTYSHLYNMETIGLRFFTVYGPWGRPDMMMWLFTEAILKDEPINIFNNGNMERDFTYIDDIVNGIMGTIDLKMNNKYEIYNLGNNNKEHLMDVVKLLEKNLNKKAKKKFLPIQPGDVKCTYANIDKAKKDLNFNPKTNIQEGIRKFINWYKDYTEL